MGRTVKRGRAEKPVDRKAAGDERSHSLRRLYCATWAVPEPGPPTPTTRGSGLPELSNSFMASLRIVDIFSYVESKDTWNDTTVQALIQLAQHCTAPTILVD